MYRSRIVCGAFAVCLATVCMSTPAYAQRGSNDDQYGPVVRAYLGYLRSEQEVVDDRVSRREVSMGYYRRNSNRIRALRQMAIQIANETQNDYLPELEAVAPDEFGLLFAQPPRTTMLKVGEVFQNTFRYLGTVRSGETFYLFARLDPYEQADLMQANHSIANTAKTEPLPASTNRSLTRTRRVSSPQ